MISPVDLDEDLSLFSQFSPNSNAIINIYYYLFLYHAGYFVRSTQYSSLSSYAFTCLLRFSPSAGVSRLRTGFMVYYLDQYAVTDTDR